MKEKISVLLGSVRFYMVVLGWASEYASQVAADGFNLSVLFSRLAMLLGSIVAIGTLDSVSEKISSKKPTPPPAIE